MKSHNSKHADKNSFNALIKAYEKDLNDLNLISEKIVNLKLELQKHKEKMATLTSVTDKNDETITIKQLEEKLNQMNSEFESEKTNRLRANLETKAKQIENLEPEANRASPSFIRRR